MDGNSLAERRDRDARAADDAIDDALAEWDEWGWDTGDPFVHMYLCWDCLDESADCPRCGGQGAAYAVLMRAIAAIAP